MSTRQLSNSSFETPEGVVLMELDPKLIHVDDNMNLRKYAPDAKGLELLSKDITEKGQLQPVVITQNGAEGEYKLVAGFRRYRAILMANENGAGLKVLARMKNFDATGGTVEEGTKSLERQALLDNLSENLKRESLSPLDQATAISVLEDNGMTISDIAKEFGKSVSWVRQVGYLLKLSPDKQKMVHRGEIPFSVARALSGLSEEEQAEVITSVENAVKAGESGKAAAMAAKAKLRKGEKRGRKAKGDASAGKKGLSAKAAILAFEAASAEIEGKDKATKAENKLVEVLEVVTKYLGGKFGDKAMVNKLVEVLG